MRTLLGLALVVTVLVSGSGCTATAESPQPAMTDQGAMELSDKEFKLSVAIEGLVAFVGEGCKEKHKSTALHTVLLKDPKHAPFIAIDSDYLEPPNHATHVIGLPGGKQLFVWNMTGHRLVIPNAPEIKMVNDKRTGRKDEPGLGEHEDFSWIAELHRACEASNPWDQDVDKMMVQEKKLPKYASARLMRLAVADNAKKGKLGSRFHKDGDKAVYRFNDSYHQALADYAQLDLTLPVPSTPNESVVLSLVPIAGGTPIQIRLKHPKTRSTVEIAVSNLPRHQETPGANEKMEKMEVVELAHFKSFFQMLPQRQRAKCKPPAEQVEGKVAGAAPVKCTLCGSCGPNP